MVVLVVLRWGWYGWWSLQKSKTRLVFHCLFVSFLLFMIKLTNFSLVTVNRFEIVFLYSLYIPLTNQTILNEMNVLRWDKAFCYQVLFQHSLQWDVCVCFVNVHVVIVCDKRSCCLRGVPWYMSYTHIQWDQSFNQEHSQHTS